MADILKQMEATPLLYGISREGLQILAAHARSMTSKAGDGILVVEGRMIPGLNRATLKEIAAVESLHQCNEIRRLFQGTHVLTAKM